jgi:hypothetical protein
MMLIGTSFGGCLQSLMLGEVSKNDVLVIITRTTIKNLEGIKTVVNEYHSRGNPWATVTSNYSRLREFDLEEITKLACDLYQFGKIHQPALYTGQGGFVHQDLSQTKLWLEVVPMEDMHHPSVIDAYTKYKMVAELAK